MREDLLKSDPSLPPKEQSTPKTPKVRGRDGGAGVRRWPKANAKASRFFNADYDRFQPHREGGGGRSSIGYLRTALATARGGATRYRGYTRASLPNFRRDAKRKKKKKRDLIVGKKRSLHQESVCLLYLPIIFG